MMLEGFTALSVEIMTKFLSARPATLVATMAFGGGGCGGIGQRLGAEDIVADRLPRIRFRQRHMLVCGGVKDDGGAEISEHLLDADGVGDVADGGGDFYGGESFSQFALDFEDRVFRLVDEHQERRFKAADGAAEFTADAAAGPADQHRLPMQQRPDRAQIHFDGIAAEHIVHAHIANLSGLGVTRQNILQTRDRAEANGSAARAVCAFADVGFHLGGARQSDTIRCIS